MLAAAASFTQQAETNPPLAKNTPAPSTYSPDKEDMLSAQAPLSSTSVETNPALSTLPHPLPALTVDITNQNEEENFGLRKRPTTATTSAEN